MTLLLLTTFCIQVSANGYAQRVSLSEKDAPLDKIFREIKKQTGYTFVYTADLLQAARRVSISVKDATLQEALDACFLNQPLTYSIVNSMVVVRKKELTVQAPMPVLQLAPVSGKVTNTGGEPLGGASVTEKGTGNAAMTREDGSFSLNVSKSNAVLVVSYVGYHSREVNLDNQGTITIILEQSNSNLNDVVVVGYGTQKRKDLTGAVATVGSQDIKDQAVTNIAQALLGKVAGVQVRPVSGAPGAPPQIRVRGIGSISAGADPLYVVDGFPTASIAMLNPNDIESMDILKDASATAIYGSRGSNGVVIINTKRGRAGKSVVSFDTYAGLQQASRLPGLMNARQQAQYFYDGVRNRNLDAGNDVSGPGSAWKLRVPQIILDVLDGKNSTDEHWLDAVLRTAPQQQYQLSASGGTDKIRYSLSGEYVNQDGIVINSNFKRYSFRANIDAQLTSRLSVKVSLNPSFTDEDLVTASGFTNGSNNESVIGGALAVTPYYPMYDAQGNYYVYSALDAVGNFWHPVALAKEILNKQKRTQFLGNLSVDYRIFDNLRFNILMGATLMNAKGMKFRPQLPAFFNEPALGSDSAYLNVNWLTEYTLNYTKTFHKHSISALGGFTAQKERVEANSLYSNKYPNNLVPTLSAVGGQLTGGTSQISEYSIVSYLARVNYNYNSKYYLTASFRTDGSSRFGRDRKYGLFPSAAVAWRLSDENFMKGLTFLTEAKLRLSYGETGNNNIGNYDHLATISYDNYTLGGVATGGFAPSRLGNPLLTWEKQRSTNAGLDVSFFNRRIGFSLDYFRSVNSDLLLNVNTPDITGFSTSLQNIGEVQNKGWELVVNTINIQRAVEWETNFNISTYRNKVTRLGPNGDPIISGGNKTMIGQPIGMFYGWLTDGIFLNQAEVAKGPVYSPGNSDASRPGDIRFRDVSGPNGKPDGIINSFDKTIMGSPYPDFYYGMTNRVTYKNVSLGVSLQGSQGNKILNQVRIGLMSTRARNEQSTLSLNYWKSEQDPGDGKTPRPNDAPTGNVRGMYSQYFLDDGSYMRINNITLGYQLPSKMIRSLKLSTFRLYATTTNPFIFTKYTSFNPDSNNGTNSLNPGIDLNDYPLPKSLILGANITF